MPQVKVIGMHCGNCQKAVEDALKKIDGIADVAVDLQNGLAHWTDANPAVPVDPEAVKRAINAIGFEA